jgi:class 3 adenylate cyclase
MFLEGEQQRVVPDSVLATVLFTDLVGSTEQAAALGDRSWRDLLARHHELVRRELERFRGVEVDTAGDGSSRASTARRGRSPVLGPSASTFEDSASSCAPASIQANASGSGASWRASQ